MIAMPNRKSLARKFHGKGVELGVAAGEFSRMILHANESCLLWSIDRWSDHHNAREYADAAKMLIGYSQGRCIPLRMTFEEAAPLFNDESLDFIYIDGYAHTGQLGGATLEQWWPKLKPGGIFSGHDYHPDWQPTVNAVNAFVERRQLELNVTDSEGEEADKYPSWWVEKPGGQPIVASPIMDKSPVKAGESVILVGNGPSALMRGNRGAWIDSFDQVVRFNWFAIRGFEAKVGTKTTLWSTFGRGSLPRDEDQRPKRAIFIHGGKPKEMAFEVEEAYGVERRFFNDVMDRVKAKSKVPYEERGKSLLPSSGLVVALWLLEVHSVPKITLFGFDHFSKKESKGHHYWINRAFKKPPEHDGEAEAEIFAELAASGKIQYANENPKTHQKVALSSSRPERAGQSSSKLSWRRRSNLNRGT